MKEIIEFFTKENEWVLDFFMGVGGTLLGASLCNRRAVGIDLNPTYIDVYIKANRILELSEQKAIVGDSLKLLKEPSQIKRQANNSEFSLVLIDPPYGDMLSRRKTGEAVKKKKNADPTPFTNLSADLGNMSRNEFFSTLTEMVSLSLNVLKRKGHIIIFMKDLQPTKEQANLLHAETVDKLQSIPNLRFLGLKIWADQGVNLYPYGYPFSFVANQIHQYILLFRKE